MNTKSPPPSCRVGVVLHRRDLVALDLLAEREELTRSAFIRRALRRRLREEAAKVEAVA